MSRASRSLWLLAAIVIAGLLPILLYTTVYRGSGIAASGSSVQASAQCVALAMHDISVPVQWMVAITAFGVKPVYLLISLVSIFWLWKEQSPDLVALRWGLIVFWLGENACSTNYLFYGGQSELWEFLHNYGMAVAFSFVTFAAMEAIDLRMIRYSAPKERCAMLNLCHTCIKYSPVRCKLRQLFTVMMPVALIVAAIPLCAKLRIVAYNVNLLGSIQTYSQPLSCQLFEIRYCPILAMILLGGSWLVLMFKRNEPVVYAKLLTAAAMGPLGFGFMRLFLFSAFSDNLLWFDEWEEITELFFTMAVAYVLWTFRGTLLKQTPTADPRVSA